MLSGRTKDYIRSAVQKNGPLIFVIATPCARPEQVVAIRPYFIMSPELTRTFDSILCQKLLQAWERVNLEIPIVCYSMENTYLHHDLPEIGMDTSDLYIFA